MKRLLLVLSVLILLGGTAWLFLRGDGSPLNPPLSLSDGSVLVFRGVTYGTNHQFAAAGWRGVLGRMLPRKLTGRLGRGPSVTTAAPSLTVWVERRGGGGGPVNPQYVLGTGTNFAPAHSNHFTSAGGGPGASIIEGYGFASFPRRGRMITLRLYDRGGGGSNWERPTLAGEITFRNPAPSAAAPWTPEPLPATKRVDDFDVTLKDVFVNADWNRRRPLKPVTNAVNASVFARLHFSRDGKRLDEWSAPKVELSDATGNRLSSSSWSGGLQEKDYELQFTGTLWPDEKAWKMRFELSRLTNFTTAELWTVRGLPLGSTNLTNNAAFATNLQGVVVQIEAVSPKSQSQATHELFIRVRPDRPDYRLTLVSVKDESGRKPSQHGSSWGGGEYKYSLDVHTNAQTLDVTLALHQSRYVEFLAQPKLLDEATAKADEAARKQRK